MLDINHIREHKEDVKKNISRRGEKYDPNLVDELLNYDKEWRKLKEEVDNLRHQRNQLSEEINKLIKEDRKIFILKFYRNYNAKRHFKRKGRGI